jgi:outer membrane biosynthesis protein TonB
MAGSSGHWLLAASLLGVLSAQAPVFAQAERPWVDPPAENAATPPAAPAPAAPPPQAATPAPAPPEPPSAPPSAQAASDKPAVEKPSSSETSPRKEAASEPARKEQAKRKSTASRKVDTAPQKTRKAARTLKREGQTARRREPNSEVSEVRPPRNGIERRARITRYGSIQEGVDAGLEVMRLRTIQLPDGRRIDILTRPDQDLASEMPDGY